MDELQRFVSSYLSNDVYNRLKNVSNSSDVTFKDFYSLMTSVAIYNDENDTSYNVFDLFKKGGLFYNGE